MLDLQKRYILSLGENLGEVVYRLLHGLEG